jgi:hypothetical protein
LPRNLHGWQPVCDGGILPLDPTTRKEADMQQQDNAAVARLNAHCFCSAVQFSVEDAFAYAFYCHCSRCRRRTGAACAAIGGIPAAKLHISSGIEQLRRLDERAGDYVAVCAQCCSPLYSTVQGGTKIHVPLGVLDGTPTKVPDHHIQVASKAPWHQICDDLPQFAEFPP